MEAAQSEKIDLLAKALCKVQKELKPVEKTRTAKIKTRTGADYSYKYADLETVAMSCREVLTNNDFAVSQTTNPARDGVELITTLMHESGQWLRGVLFLPAEMDAQKFGAALTYARRYSLCAITGIVADEDNDAGGAGKKPGNPPKATGNKSTPPATKIDTSNVKCPKPGCGAPMVEKQKKDGGKFLGCSKYRETGCKGSMPIPKLDDLKTESAANMAKLELPWESIEEACDAINACVNNKQLKELWDAHNVALQKHFGNDFLVIKEIKEERKAKLSGPITEPEIPF